MGDGGCTARLTKLVPSCAIDLAAPETIYVASTWSFSHSSDSSIWRVMSHAPGWHVAALLSALRSSLGNTKEARFAPQTPAQEAPVAFLCSRLSSPSWPFSGKVMIEQVGASHSVTRCARSHCARSRASCVSAILAVYGANLFRLDYIGEVSHVAANSVEHTIGFCHNVGSHVLTLRLSHVTPQS